MRFSAKFRPRMFEAGAASWTEGLLHPSTRRVTNRLSRYIRTTALRKLNTTCILVSGRVLTLRYYASQLKFMIFLLSLSLFMDLPFSCDIPLSLSLSPSLSLCPTPQYPPPPPLSILSHSRFSNLVEKPCMYFYLAFQQSFRNSSALGTELAEGNWTPIFSHLWRGRRTWTWRWS